MYMYYTRKFNFFLASGSRILTKLLEVVMQNQKDLKFLSTKVMGLEGDNKILQKDLSEIKDAIESSDKSLKAVSSNKKEHGWIDVSNIKDFYGVYYVFLLKNMMLFVRFIFHI